MEENSTETQLPETTTGSLDQENVTDTAEGSTGSSELEPPGDQNNLTETRSYYPESSQSNPTEVTDQPQNLTNVDSDVEVSSVDLAAERSVVGNGNVTTEASSSSEASSDSSTTSSGGIVSAVANVTNDVHVTDGAALQAVSDQGFNGSISQNDASTAEAAPSTPTTTPITAISTVANFTDIDDDNSYNNTDPTPSIETVTILNVVPDTPEPDAVIDTSLNTTTIPATPVITASNLTALAPNSTAGTAPNATNITITTQTTTTIVTTTTMTPTISPGALNVTLASNNSTSLEVGIPSSNGRENVNAIVSKRPDPNVGLSGNGSSVDLDDPDSAPATTPEPEGVDPSFSREVDHRDQPQLRRNQTNNLSFALKSVSSLLFFRQRPIDLNSKLSEWLGWLKPDFDLVQTHSATIDQTLACMHSQ